MADIDANDIKIYQAEDQTDTDSGGGLMSPNVVVSGVVNNLFPNISRVDRLNGRIQFRKVFQKVDSANTAVYSGAHIIIRDVPLDENVSFLLFKPTAWDDLRSDIVDYVENYYQSSTPAGNAGLEYAVSAEDKQLVFKTRDYEYMPIYDKDGNLVYTKKVDAKYALNITVGDLLILDDGAGTTEYIQVDQIDIITENLDNADFKHYWTVTYAVVTLADPLQNGFSAGVIPYRTTRNTAWKAYGAALVEEEIATDDTAVNLASAKTRIAPVIYTDIQVSNQAFFGPPSIESDVTVTVDNITLDIGQTEQIQVSESFLASANKKAYTYVLQNPPMVTSSLSIWYLSDGGWRLVTETNGTLSGDGSGVVSSSMLSVIFSAQPDSGTDIILLYTRSIGYSVNENTDLVNASINYSTDQKSAIAETKTVSGTLTDFPVLKNYVQVSVDQNDGNGMVLLGSDTGYGVFQGTNIDSGTINYNTGEWSVTFKNVYTSGFIVQIKYVKLFAYSKSGSGTVAGSSGTKNFSLFFSLDAIPAVEGTFSIDIGSVFYSSTYYMTTQSQRLSLSDDSSGNIVDGVGTIFGSIDYTTGNIRISGSFPNVIAGNVSYIFSYSYYKSSVFNSAVLPFNFSVGKENVLPDSLLLKYYTQGVTNPWYARDIDGVLKLIRSFTEWESGTTFAPPFPTFDAVFDGSQWCLADGAQSATLSEGWVSPDGKTWTRSVQWNGSNQSNFCLIAVKRISAISHLYVVVKSEEGAGTNIAYSTNMVDWTEITVYKTGSTVALFKDLCYSPDIGLFVALGDDFLFTSSDGATWVKQTIPITGGLRVCKAATLSDVPVVICLATSGQAMYSTNGVDWTATTSALSGVPVDAAVVSINDIPTLICVADNGSVSKSSDGIIFLASSVSISGTPVSMTAGDITILAVSLDDGTLAISSDGAESWEISAITDTWGTNNVTKVFADPDAGWLVLAYGNDGASDQMKPFALPFSALTDVEGDAIIDVGTFDAETGTGSLTAGDAPQSIQARYFLTEFKRSDFIVFTRGAGPVHDNTFMATALTYTGATLILEEDETSPGDLTGDGAGTLDKDRGVAILNFSLPVMPESIRLSFSYGTIYHPQYEEINTNSLPMDGMVNIFHDGDVAVLIEFARSELTADLTDSATSFDVKNGAIYPDREITVKINDEQILGTMNNNTFLVSSGGRGYNSTVAVAHDKDTVVELISRNEEMLPILHTEGNRITFPNKILNNYKAEGALLTTALVNGDEQALVTDHFSQESWDHATWQDSDEYTGNPAGGAYDFTNYPLVLTNLGATTERWIFEVKSLSPVTVDIRGENLGVIATNQAITSDLEPINPNTSAPYFSLSKDGWGAGWQVGNILRSNTQGAGAPAWVCRVVNARASDQIDDYATIQSRGDVAV